MARRKLDMFSNDFLVDGRKPFATHWESLDRLERAGFRVNPHRKRCESIGREELRRCKRKGKLTRRLGYEIDGLVV